MKTDPYEKILKVLEAIREKEILTDTVGVTLSHKEVGLTQDELADILDGLERKLVAISTPSNDSSFYVISNTAGNLRFEEHYKKIRTETKRSRSNHTMARFDHIKGLILIEDDVIQLPLYKNEYYFCREMFKRGIGEPVSWDTIYEELEKPLSSSTARDKRAMYDTMRAINKRVIRVTGRPLFISRDKVYLRQF